jgi:inorganic phosphate transporter, PiT family
VDRWFRRLQLVSAALYSLGHGANDAQKTMGIIAGALFAGGYITEFYIPFWVEMIGLHRDLARHPLGRLAHHPHDGLEDHQAAAGGRFAAETAGAVSLFTATSLGVPVSTTHTITGAIVGVGSTRRLSAVRWGVAGQIVWAWVLTIPASAAIAAATFYLLDAVGMP